MAVGLSSEYPGINQFGSDTSKANLARLLHIPREHLRAIGL